MPSRNNLLSRSTSVALHRHYLQSTIVLPPRPFSALIWLRQRCFHGVHFASHAKSVATGNDIITAKSAFTHV